MINLSRQICLRRDWTVVTWWKGVMQSKTGEKEFPGGALVTRPWLASDFNHCSEGKHITLYQVGYLSLCSWKTFWEKEGFCEVRQNDTSFKPGQNAILHHGFPTLSGLRSFIKMGDFVSPWGIWSIYLRKAWLETGHVHVVVKAKWKLLDVSSFRKE